MLKNELTNHLFIIKLRSFAVCIYLFHYVFIQSEGIVLSLLVSQTTKGTQGMLIFITIVLGIVTSSVLLLSIKEFYIVI